jgi:hypothetical protein
MRLSGETNEDILQGITSRVDPKVSMDEIILTIGFPNNVPAIPTETLLRWKALSVLMNENLRVTNAIVQIRVMSMNPLSIYQAILMTRDRSYIRSSDNIKGRVFLEGFSETSPSIIYKEGDKDVVGDAQMEERSDDVSYISDDFPEGCIVDINAEVPFFGFPLKGLYPNMARMHMLEKAGFYAVFVDSDQDFDRYEQYCRKWGIQVVDRVLTEEIRTLPYILGVQPISPMLIVKRHLNLFHDAPWASATANRTRGLGMGLPWAMKMSDGKNAIRPFEFFFSDITTVDKDMLFLLPSSRSLAYLNRKLKEYWFRVYNKDYPMDMKRWGNNIYSIRVRDIGEWVQFRAMVRKILI